MGVMYNCGLMWVSCVTVELCGCHMLLWNDVGVMCNCGIMWVSCVTVE